MTLAHCLWSGEVLSEPWALILNSQERFRNKPSVSVFVLQVMESI